MPEQFNNLRTKIRNWANRDLEALPDAVIEDTMHWAADKAYRTLRVPPLESIVVYTGLTQVDSTASSIRPTYSFEIPADLIEFIQIREVDDANNYIRVFNEKADVRTFTDDFSEKYNDYAYWTRKGSSVLLKGFGIREDSNIELYYYRRLPALNARYDVTLENYNAGLLENAAGVAIPAPDPAATDAADIPAGAMGQEYPNWLRDSNERIILFGALAECFAYLQEDDQVAKYSDMFFREIEELNREDQMRTASGGNVQMNFNGRGLI